MQRETSIAGRGGWIFFKNLGGREALPPKVYFKHWSTEGWLGFSAQFKGINNGNVWKGPINQIKRIMVAWTPHNKGMAIGKTCPQTD